MSSNNDGSNDFKRGLLALLEPALQRGELPDALDDGADLRVSVPLAALRAVFVVCFCAWLVYVCFCCFACQYC